MILKSKDFVFHPYDASWAIQLKSFMDDSTYAEMWRHHPWPFSEAEIVEYNKYISGMSFMVCLKDSHIPVAFVQIVPSVKTNRAFDFGLLVAKEAMGNRYPQQITCALLNYLFKSLGYRKATVEILASNKGLKHTLETCGFELEGTLKEEAFINGKFVDELRYCGMAEEFDKRFDEEIKAWLA